MQKHFKTKNKFSKIHTRPVTETNKTLLEETKKT